MVHGNNHLVGTIFLPHEGVRRERETIPTRNIETPRGLHARAKNLHLLHRGSRNGRR